MRVITGSAKGCRLQTLEGDDVRPTGERVKEGLFSAIQFDIEGCRVLDLFAGSGQLGIEALSRGAASCVFTDSSKQAVQVIRENVAHAHLEEKAAVLQTDAFAYLGGRAAGQEFDLIFLDPPYAKGLLQRALEQLPLHVAEGGTVMCESPLHEPLPEQIGALSLQRSYRYGKTAVHLFRKIL